MVERELSEREETGRRRGGRGRGKIEGSEIARISRIFGFYAFLGIDTSVRRGARFLHGYAVDRRAPFPACPVCAWERERESFLIIGSLFHRYRSKTIYGGKDSTESKLFYLLLREVGSGWVWWRVCWKGRFLSGDQLFSAILILFGEIYVDD